MSTQVQNDHQQSMTPSSVGLFDLEPRTDLNGLIVYQPGEAARYLVDGGYKCLLPSANLVNAVFIPYPPRVETQYDVSKIPTGQSVAGDAVLIKADDSPDVYLVDFAPQPNSGEIFKRPIKSMETFNRYQFDWNKIHSVPPIVVRGLPTGPELAPPTQTPA